MWHDVTLTNMKAPALAALMAIFMPCFDAAAADDWNVVWTSPSRDAQGSMPLGNGDIGLNAWVEPSGELVFYVSKTDAWDDYGRLLKVGRVRVTMDPAPVMTPFRQELAMESGTLVVRYGDGTTLRLWADANHPVVHVESQSSKPMTVTAGIEMWRTEPRTVRAFECSDVLNQKPGNPTMVLEPDHLVSGLSDRTAWYHHNIKSVGPAEHAAIQGMADFPRVDPLLHRTFGAVITTPHPNRLDDGRLQSNLATQHRFDIHVLTQHPSTPEAWLQSAKQLADDQSAQSIASLRAAHEKWWSEFWNRSWIRAHSTVASSPVPSNNHPLKIGEDQQGGTRFGGQIRNVIKPANTSGPFSIAAEVQPNQDGGGRIFDQIQIGGTDGFLLDMPQPGSLRLIVGSQQKIITGALPAGKWSTVTLTAAQPEVVVSVNGQKVLGLPAAGAGDAAQELSRMVAMQRFITACGGRGAFPIKFNGSIFTMPAHGDPDYRKWGPGYWWQNSRLPYISACANGDYDLLEPLFAMYADRLRPYHMQRTKNYFGFENAAYFPECVLFWGDIFNETYGWTPVAQRKDPLQQSGWHKWEWVAGPELVWMMLEAYEHTGDLTLLQKRIVPTADAVIRFFDQYYKTNADGKLVMHPAMACETWWDCTNPMPELAGLRAITAKLLALPHSLVAAETRTDWQSFAAKLAPLPVRETPTGHALAPAEKFAAKSNVENPELYAVFPFRLCAFEKDNRDLGIQALHHRWDRGHSGWRQDDIFMAYLGLTDEAKSAVTARSQHHDPNARFPAFWGPNYDWTPDQDHGGVLIKATQAMLMQTDGQAIYLLPAWPSDWDVSFKLHAPSHTTVECELKGGKIIRLLVTPESRRKDVICAAPYHLKN